MDRDLTSLIKYAALSIQLQMIRARKEGFQGGGERYEEERGTLPSLMVQVVHCI